MPLTRKLSFCTWIPLLQSEIEVWYLNFTHASINQPSSGEVCGIQLISTRGIEDQYNLASDISSHFSTDANFSQLLSILRWSNLLRLCWPKLHHWTEPSIWTIEGIELNRLKDFRLRWKKLTCFGFFFCFLSWAPAYSVISEPSTLSAPKLSLVLWQYSECCISCIDCEATCQLPGEAHSLAPCTKEIPFN